MTKLSLFTQILMIVIAVIIMVMYIKPTVSHIRMVQDTTLQYSMETDKVSSVNKLLEVQVNKIDVISQPDTLALKRFMPDSVDELEVMKDLITICAAAGITDPTVAFKGAAVPVGGDGSVSSVLTEQTDGMDSMKTYPFAVSALMTYQQMKLFLAALEVNDYLLQIDTLSVKPSESGELTVEIALSTFARPIVSVAATNVVPVTDSPAENQTLN